MFTEVIKDNLQHAENALYAVENELKRPEEDVMTVAACMTVRTTMRLMMQQYLDAHAVPHPTTASLHDLLEQCTKSNAKFHSVDIRNVECKGENHEHCDDLYCMTINNVDNCVSVAHQIKSVIWNEFHL